LLKRVVNALAERTAATLLPFDFDGKKVARGHAAILAGGRWEHSKNRPTRFPEGETNMTNESASDVGQVVIDEYLDSVERALIASRAPRSERTQVVQDLESQIAEMLAAEPQPLTEDSVSAVIARLEPAAHFAATYGNGTKEAAHSQPRVPRWVTPRVSWAVLAAISCWMIPIAALLIMMAGRSADGLTLLLLFMVGAGILFGPFALWKAVREMQSSTPAASRRDMVMIAAMVYSMVVPVLLMVVAVGITEEGAFVALGVIGFIYFQYLLVRRVHGYFGRFAPPRESNLGLTSGVCAPTA
jgi:HAAS domain-containing protein